MDNRQTVESIKARQIYAEIQGLPKPFVKTYNVFEADTAKIGAVLRDLIGPSFKTGISISVKPNCLVIGSKTPRREYELEKMVRKLALHCDSEALYEEAQRLVGTV